VRPFVHLQNASTYLPGLWDFRIDREARSLWRGRLLENAKDLVALVAASQDAAAVARAETASASWSGVVSRLEEDETCRSYPTVLDLVTLRDRLLRQHDVDPFARVKESENERCLALPLRLFWPSDRGDDPVDDVLHACLAVLAGNVFDMAAPAVAEAYARGPDALVALATDVLKRGPTVDDRAALRGLIEPARGERTALVFADNAGIDFLQGVVPLALALERASFRVVLAANEHPSLNDVTAAEAERLLHDVAAREDDCRRALGSGRLRVVSTGAESSGIDLRAVSPALDAAAASADLLIFVGQGRAIETTWLATLARPTVRLATIKSRLVAARLGFAPLDSVIEVRLPGKEKPQPARD